MQEPATDPGSLQEPATNPGSLQEPATNPGSLQEPASDPGSLQAAATDPGSLQEPATDPGSLQEPATNPGSLQEPASDPGSLQAAATDLTITFDNLIIATGAVPIKLPFIKEYTNRIMDAERALNLESIPENLLVIGGGYIGMESATIYKALGSKVSLVEATAAIMPTMDEELVKIYLKQNKELFEEKWFETFVTGLEEKGGKVIVTMKSGLNSPGFQPGDKGTPSDEFTREFDAVLLSIGMRPNTASLALENAGVITDERGFIKADGQGKTNVPNIYAIGDVAGGMLLAHKASYQGRVAAEVIAGQKSAWDARAVPAVVYTIPEIATAGLSEKECKEQGIAFRTVKFPWSASGRAIANGETAGLTKLIIEEGTERILGAGIVGSNAGDLISEAVLGIEMAARVSDIALTIHPHPTVSETIMEAAELYHGTPTHVAPMKKRDA
jgi:dihydrolipoamide dehydrogenase